MKVRLLDYLVCPFDQSSFSVNASEREDGEILEGELSCENGHRYSIRQGVPRLFLNEALEEQAKKTQESFSGKWKRIPNFGHELRIQDHRGPAGVSSRQALHPGCRNGIGQRHGSLCREHGRGGIRNRLEREH